MLLENNPATGQQHLDWQQRIINRFPEINFSESYDYLSLIRYIDKSPQKFFSRIAFDKYLLFLENTKIQDPLLLGNILIEAEPFLSISNRILTEINEKPIHDILLPNEHNELINFIDKEIHYNLLKLYETPFFQLIYIISKYFWLKKGKKIDGLDLYNSVAELSNVGFSFIDPIYLHDVRNGIAHGKTVFTDNDITYFDKKGNKATIPTKKIIEVFDRTLDITNGFCLAFKVFCFTNPAFLESYNISIPQSILLEELQSKADAPAWKITNCLESVALHDKKQLMIYIKNDYWDYAKVYWYCFTTAYWAERLTKSYDRIFLNLHSLHSQISPTGFAAFDGVKLKELREKNETEIEAYKGVLENDLLYFIPKMKFPRLIYKIGTILSIIKTSFPIDWRKNINTNFPTFRSPFFIRETQIHHKRYFSVVQDPSVIVKPDFHSNIEQLIRVNKKKIIKLAINYSRKKCSRFSRTRYLPVKYIRVFVYDTDMRVRNLRFSGLIPELIASIEVNKSKHIKTIDILGGKPEQIGKYRIVWNENWNHKKLNLTQS